MKRRIAVTLSMVLALGLVSGSAFASDKDAKKGDASQDAMMEMMMKYAMPGPMHDLLKPMAGNWKTTAKSWMKPGAEPTVSEGTCESSFILGNRYLQSTYKGDMEGMPFEGFGLMGYDNMKKEFVSVWADNMGTGLAMSDGAADASGKTLTMKSMMNDPQSGKMVPYTMTTKIMDENTYTMSMSTKKGGKDQMQMEITYTRIK